MTAGGNVPDDKDVGLCLFCRSVHHLRDIAAIDADFGLCAHVLLKQCVKPWHYCV
jgi:hypothetical protein